MDLKHLIPHQRRREFGPALNFQFATDKTLVPRVGFTPTFTRASGATFVNSSGLIQYAPENLIRQSQTFSNAVWSTFGNGTKISASTIADPSGGLAAYVINVGTTGTSGLIYQQYATTYQASRCTYSIWIRSVSGTSDFAIRNYNGSTNLSSGTLTATTTWTRFEFTFTDIIYQFQIASVSASAVGNILVWGAQAERSGTAGTYIPTTTGGIHLSRSDHDPATLVCKGLLMEDQRTNLFLRSGDFTSSWAAVNATISPNVTTSPDGLTTADKLINVITANGRIQQSPVLTGSHTMSVFAKAAEWNWILLSPLGANTGCWFNLSNGTVGTQVSGYVGSITRFGNGWYRCSVSFTGTGAATTSRIIATNADNTLTSGDGTSGIFIWGAQLESGAFASSYIPTVTGTVARSSDTCSLGGFARFCSQIEGTLAVKATTIGSTFVGVVSMIAADRSLCAVNVTRTNATQLRLGVVQGPGFVEAATFNTAVLINAEFKCAVSFKQNDFAGSANGLATQTDTSGVFPSSPLNLMHIGYNGGQRMFGWISSIQYYRQRLPNSSLQALSAIVTNTITYNGVQIQYNSSGNGLQTTN